jgi:hypothetical protein
MMIHAIATMLLVTVISVIAVHLALTETIARIALRIARCERCTAFWSVLFILALTIDDYLTAVALAITAALLSHWFAFVLIVLQKLYDRIWQKLNNNSRHNNRSRHKQSS